MHRLAERGWHDSRRSGRSDEIIAKWGARGDAVKEAWKYRDHALKMLNPDS